MEEATVVALVVAFATLIVAIVTLINNFILRSQLKLVEKQTILQRSNVYPFLEVESENFRKNKISLKLKNRGEGPAFSVGLCLGFTPLKKSGGQFDFPEIYEIENNKKKRVYPSRNVVFLKYLQKAPVLHPNAEGSLEGEAIFCYSYFQPKKKPMLNIAEAMRKEEPVYRKINFDELRAMLLKNNIQFVAIGVSVVYKDITESIVEHNPLHDVVADLGKHTSLEDVIKENIPFLQRNVLLEELDSIPLEIYEELKSRRAFLEWPFKFGR
jgi:hypothetical protein